MSTPNQDFINKAVVTTDAIASAGKLSPQQANMFVDYVKDETGLLRTPGVRIARFRNESWEVDKLGLSNRVAVPHTEASDPGVRNTVTHSKVSLTPKAIMVPFEISELYMQHNLEGGSVEDHILRMMARQVANNIEQIYWYGNTLGPAIAQSEWPGGGSSSLYRKDTLYGLLNGLLTQAESGNVIDHANGDMDYTLISKMINSMPNKFKMDKRALRLMLSMFHEQLYLENTSTRATGLGDVVLNGGGTPSPFGVPLAAYSLLEHNPIHVDHVTLNGTTAAALSYKNMSDVVVTPSSLSTNAIAPYVLTTDYTLDATNGTITRVGGGAIGDGDTVKVTYRSTGRQILTNPSNIIVGFGINNMSIEKDRNIYKKVNEYTIYFQTDIIFEETSAVVLAKNIKNPY